MFFLVLQPHRAGLTDDAELNRVRGGRLGRDLALVLAGVARLHELDHQGPVVPGGVTRHLEARVVGVRVRARGQDVQIPAADPGHLPAERPRVRGGGDGASGRSAGIC